MILVVFTWHQFRFLSDGRLLRKVVTHIIVVLVFLLRDIKKFLGKCESQTYH